MAFTCDLHAHSSASDGALAPKALVDEAARRGVTTFALTDHDTTRGLAAAQARAAELGIELIPGIELSVSEDQGRRQMHILGLGIDPAHPELVRVAADLDGQRVRRVQAMVERLRELGIEIDAAQVRERAGDAALGRPHVARVLVASGVCRDADEAFARFLGRGRPAFVPRLGLCARDAIAAIHESGGVASLAHPNLSVGVDAPGGLEAFVDRVAGAGLDGLEVEHPSHTPAMRKRLRRMARAYGLLATGGSDFHGDRTQDAPLGSLPRQERSRRELYAGLVERLERRGRRLTPVAPASNLARPL
jgi:predicted metal-dependent phosphoesterase TrpH